MKWDWEDGMGLDWEDGMGLGGWDLDDGVGSRGWDGWVVKRGYHSHFNGQQPAVHSNFRMKHIEN